MPSGVFQFSRVALLLMLLRVCEKRVRSRISRYFFVPSAAMTIKPQVEFSPFEGGRLAVATAQYFGIVGNGRLHVIDRSAQHSGGLREVSCTTTLFESTVHNSLTGRVAAAVCVRDFVVVKTVGAKEGRVDGQKEKRKTLRPFPTD